MTPETTARCPECDSPMVQRTARRGRNKGEQFWGCSRYPNCRGTRDLAEPQGSPGSEQSQQAPGPGSPARPPVDLGLPVTFIAGPDAPGRQCAFFQSAALPASIVDAVERQDIDLGEVARFAHWRLDYPMPSKVFPDPSVDDTLALAEDLLLRGSTPLCFPELERLVYPEELASLQTGAIAKELASIIATPTAPHTPTVFDSDEERQLLAQLVEFVTLEELSWSFQTQVALASLCPDAREQASQRCDLLAVHVSGSHIVVEVDGEQHADHLDADRQRDDLLAAVGVDVLRVPAREVRERTGGSIDALKTRLLSVGSVPDAKSSRGIRWHRSLHQLQVTIVRAIRSGDLPLGEDARILVELPKVLDEDSHADEYLAAALRTLGQLVEHLADLWGKSGSLATLSISRRQGDGSHPTGGLYVSFRLPSSPEPTRSRTYAISDTPLPRTLSVDPTGGTSAQPCFGGMSQHGVEWFLKYLFRKEGFWEGQWEAVERALSGQDSVVLLPTGAGKSIAFQLAALLRPGRCIVVDPIVALIDDQIENLRSYGIDRCGSITGRHRPNEKKSIQHLVGTGHYLFIYVAPERFQSVPFRESLRGLTAHSMISAVVIDEAHCVSEWGHDFRTAYLNLGRIAREYCRSEAGFVPPLVALTGTASRIVLKDVQRALEIQSPDAVITPKSFDRPELRFSVIECHSSEKQARIKGILDGLPSRFRQSRQQFFHSSGEEHTASGIIFCPHVNGDFGTASTAKTIEGHLGINVPTYSGSAPRGSNWRTWDATKRRTARSFKRDEAPLLVATNAFGMGIDKPNIRYTLHLGLPASIESFYQEAGRAGRDRASAACSVVISVDDEDRARYLLAPSTSLDELTGTMKSVKWEQADDVTRALFFHTNTFKGVRQDLGDIQLLLAALGDLSKPRRARITWTDDAWGAESRENDPKARSERGLHRLVLLQVVKDYSINWASSEYEVDVAAFDRATVAEALASYGRAYQVRRGEILRQHIDSIPDSAPAQFLIATAEVLLRFIYETVELARRRALSEMVQAAVGAAEAENSDDALRKRVLDYLSQTEWDKRLEDLLEAGEAGMADIPEILDDVITHIDITELRAAAGRLLASYPDVPSLLYLRGFAELLATTTNEAGVIDDVRAGTQFALSKYRLDPLAMAETILVLTQAATRRPDMAEVILHSALAVKEIPRETVIRLVGTLPSELASIAANRALSILGARVVEIFEEGENL
jgi:ATP-dependent DNA helicase RecQ